MVGFIVCLIFFLFLSMKFLSFESLLSSNLHLSSGCKPFKSVDGVYRVINGVYILDLTYTAVSLFRLYKFFSILNNRGIYVTFVYLVKLFNRKFLKLITRYTVHNFFNNHWIYGSLTNGHTLKAVLLAVAWIEKLRKAKFRVPRSVFRVYSKSFVLARDLKFSGISKFVFFLNLDCSGLAVKECACTNKFLSGLCSPSFDVGLIDFYIYSNCTNEVSINFILKFVLASYFSSFKV
ncbi:conserved hypothetical protein (apicoplast) [Theileria equi strain WA]|uniref:Uncharacterized protein n=1 Tax=Theileria equi strain WA TaxID=1537102 RepID=L1L8X8_THEEQ|nr:conserved hypothetical protein [Theileria equi strain WA]EKX71961.1 conserved hypothetical protein [Theileria equi strain WA]|eukprot:XP_025033554.1 conserved hypothetical protein (apicoplast) [Theileria equi strain WA]